MDVYSNPIEYKKQINDLSDRYLIILNELTKSYPQAKAFTEDKKINETFNNDTSNFNKIQSDFFILQDKLKQDIQQISISIEDNNKIINILDKENTKIKKELSSLKDIKLGSKQMFKDTRYTYQMRFIENSILFVGILSMAYNLTKRFIK